MLGYGARAIKYLLFIFNFVFVITGISLISVGLMIKAVYTEYESLLDDRFLSAPTLLVTAGTVIFFIAFFGCCGAVKENHCMVFTFSVLLGAVFVMELVAGITGYVLSDQTVGILTDTLNKSMHYYNHTKDEGQTKLWDTIQTKFHCCGAKNYTDWYDVFNQTVLPMSCCDPQIGALGTTECTEASRTLHKASCLNNLAGEIQANALTIGGVGIGIAIIQLLGVLFACNLAKSIRESSSYETV